MRDITFVSTITINDNDKLFKVFYEGSEDQLLADLEDNENNFIDFKKIALCHNEVYTRNISVRKNMINTICTEDVPQNKVLDIIMDECDYITNSLDSKNKVKSMIDAIYEDPNEDEECDEVINIIQAIMTDPEINELYDKIKRIKANNSGL